MNNETIAAMAESKLASTSGPLKDFRKMQLDFFKAKGLKETTLDSYKFTNLDTFFSTLTFNKSSGEELPKSEATFPTISFTNGVVTTSGDFPSELLIKRVKDHFKEIKDFLNEDNALSRLHHGLLNDGLFIEVPKNYQGKTPIRILNILSESSIEAPAHLIVANPQSSICIIEETIATSVSHAQISETYLIAKDGAQIEHVAVEGEGKEGLNHGSVYGEIAENATIRSFFLNGSGKLNRKNLNLNLNAPGANGESYSLFLTNGSEHSDINTIINHRAADTTSRQIAKGILDGESKGVFTGKIHIHPKAQRVASSQLNKNLLLSRKAQVHSQPQLEIFADDVKCSHGSTTGQLSDDEVFYFQARGIPADRARSILAHGFGLEIVHKIQNKQVRSHVETIMMKNLETKFNIGRIT